MSPAAAQGRHGLTSARLSAASQAAAVAGRSFGCSASGATSAVARRVDKLGRAVRSVRTSPARFALNAAGPPPSASNATAARLCRSARPSTRPLAACSGAM